MNDKELDRIERGARYWTVIAPWYFLPPVFCAGVYSCFLNNMTFWVLATIMEVIWFAWLCYGIHSHLQMKHLRKELDRLNQEDVSRRN